MTICATAPLTDVTSFFKSGSKKNQKSHYLNATLIETPLGQLIGIASEQAVHLVTFVDAPKLSAQVTRLKQMLKSELIPEENVITNHLRTELKAYFSGTLRRFTTPMEPYGTAFQLKAWTALQKIQFGQTCSYRAEAITIDAPTAFRAVAQANGANPIGILIPCHRVVAANGTLGGYNSGVWRKTWLLAHEASVLTKNYQVDDQ